MNHSVLYIIGNGFDIHHGIKSQYSDFGKYLSENNRELYDNVIEYILFEERWSDLEMALADLDIDSILEQNQNLLVSYAHPKWKESYNHDYPFEIRRIINLLSKDLKEEFYKWLNTLDIPNHANIDCSALNIDKEGLFINFNYTPTLEHVYQVPKKNILFIHGKRSSEKSKIILGHGWNPKEIPNLNDVPDRESMDARVIQGNLIINNYFVNTFKPAREIINQNRCFFDKLSSVSRVYVLGHSLSKVDHPYIEEVINCVSSDSLWKVSYHKDGDKHKAIRSKDKHKATMNNLGVEKNVELNCLQSILAS